MRLFILLLFFSVSAYAEQGRETFTATRATNQYNSTHNQYYYRGNITWGSSGVLKYVTDISWSFANPENVFDYEVHGGGVGTLSDGVINTDIRFVYSSGSTGEATITITYFICPYISGHCIKFVCGGCGQSRCKVDDTYTHCDTCNKDFCNQCTHTNCGGGGCNDSCVKQACPICKTMYCPTHDSYTTYTCQTCKKTFCSHQEPHDMDKCRDDNGGTTGGGEGEGGGGESEGGGGESEKGDYSDIIAAINEVRDEIKKHDQHIDEMKGNIAEIAENIGSIQHSLDHSGTYGAPEGLEPEGMGSLPDNDGESLEIGDGPGLTDGIGEIGGLGEISGFSPTGGSGFIITFPLSLVGFGMEDVTFNVTESLVDFYTPLRSVLSVIVWIWGTYMSYCILRDGLTLAG